MGQLSLEAIRRRLRTFDEREHAVIATQIGIPFSTLRKFVYGTTQNPRYTTFEKLHRWYRKSAR